MEIIRSWREQKVLLKMRFPYLEDADLEFEEAQMDQMLAGLSLKLKKTREELKKVFAELQLS